ncbi:FAD:protein FMN transferase [Limibacter armeniacum]|uniref:FAD:protein FMN transferase n=1 Tax=Limibacter armeniacum TaxID=466084 RepID=UPI002FE5E834
MDNRTKNIVYSVVLFALMGAVWLYRQNSEPEKTTHFLIEGQTMGTIYHIKYIDLEGRMLKDEVDSLLVVFNQSLSTYIKDSEISRFNDNDSLVYESQFFYPILKSSYEIYENTNGAFEPTVLPLVKAWGFGPGKRQELNEEKVDSLMSYIGMDKVQFDDHQVKKTEKGVQLDFSALAKGYGVDVVAQLLDKKGIKDYMVEIGGEVVCRGVNEKGDVWAIGIDNPKYQEEGGKAASAIVKLKDKALATSGNYRNFYIKDGKKYAHTLDPRTGYPVQHSLLSASVFAPDCMTADAYATAFMVLGKDSAMQILSSHSELEGLLIYDEDGELKVFSTDGVDAVKL